MVQLFLAKKLISFVIGYALGQLLVAAITDSPIKKNAFYILGVAVIMNAIIESILLYFLLDQEFIWLDILN